MSRGKSGRVRCRISSASETPICLVNPRTPWPIYASSAPLSQGQASKNRIEGRRDWVRQCEEARRQCRFWSNFCLAFTHTVFFLYFHLEFHIFKSFVSGHIFLGCFLWVVWSSCENYSFHIRISTMLGVFKLVCDRTFRRLLRITNNTQLCNVRDIIVYRVSQGNMLNQYLLNYRIAYSQRLCNI